MTVPEKIREDLEGIYIGNLNTVDEDLKLPTEGGNGSVFTWETSDERFINTDGKIGRPLAGMGNRKVWLTCTAELAGQWEQKVFEATVLQEEKRVRIKELLPVKLTISEGEDAVLPSVVIAYCEGGRYVSLPVSWGKLTDAAAGQTCGGAGEGTKRQTCGGADGGTKRQICEGTVEETDLPARAEVTYTAPQEVGNASREVGNASQEVGNASQEVGNASEEDGKAPKEKISYYPIQKVRLLPGNCYWKFQSRMNAYLLSVSDDTMLYNFRKASGLSTRGAEPMTGWDADECKLKGHTTGHYLSGLALAYAATGDPRFKEKIDYMVEELCACRDALAAGGKTKPGYLGAYDEEQFDLLEKFTKYPEIWAPYYTLEKIMSGLYDIYTLAGNAAALDLLKGLGDWTYARLSRLPAATLKRMWSMYIAGEFGGMIGILAKLYGLTGEKKYLRTAELFYNDRLFYPMEQGVDTLEDMHANQHIPQIVGAMELFRVTGNEKYHRIGRNFWEIVTGHHCYRIGGTGETEMFHGRDCEDAYLTDKSAESCASYNLLRLTGQLFAYEPKGRLMDYYENTLLNHLLSTASKAADGGTTYFFPLGPGMQKEYSTEENTCCHGTGLESRYRFMEHIYAADDTGLYVNYYVPSELEGLLQVTWGEDGIVTVRALKDMDLSLRLRIPAWAQKTVGITRARSKESTKPIPAGESGISSRLNGTLQDGYFAMTEPLQAGESVELHFPMGLREIPADGRRLCCLAEGPFLLAAVDARKEYMNIQHVMKSLVRLNRIDREHYHVYFEK